MGVVVRFGKVKALLRLGEWRSSDARVEDLLNRTTAEWIQATGGPPPDARNPDHHVAEELCRRQGGRILLKTANGKMARDRYLARRQMSFDFHE